jgi:DNA-binding protein YbaB
VHGMDGSPEEILNQLSNDAQRRIRDYQRLRDDISNMAATAHSDDRSVTVTVAPGGAVTDIVLTEKAMRHGPKNLSRMLMTTITQASADISRRMAERVQDIAPSIDVIGMVQARLPELGDPQESRERKE